MAKLTQMTFGYRRSHRLAEYENVTAECSAVVDFDPGDDLADVAEIAWGVVKANVKRQILEADKNQAHKAIDVYLGLPPEVARTLRVKTLGDAADEDQNRWTEADAFARLIQAKE